MGIVSRWAKDIGRKAAKRALEERKGEISEAIVEAVKPELTRAVERVVADHFRKSPRFRFIKYMQFELQRIDKNMSNKIAFRTARATLHEHLRDEKIEFGDERYAWGKGGAVDLIHAYEIDHWDRA